MESKYPVLVEKYALRPDSGGPGRYRGGLGAETIVRALAPLTVNTYIDRVNCQPWGLDGGESGAGNEVGIRRRGEWQADVENGKAISIRLAPGDAFMVRSGGGGGFGPATLRPAEQVADDVIEGYVSADVARNSYGVALDANGQLDHAATVALRAQKAAE